MADFIDALNPPEKYGRRPGKDHARVEYSQEKKDLFVQHFCATYDVRNAARAIGAKHPDQTGHQLMADPYVKAKIKEQLAPIYARLEVTKERVLGALAMVAFGDIRDVCEWDNDGVYIKPSTLLEKWQSYGVVEVTQTQTQYGTNVRVKMADKIQAVDRLGRYLKLFADTGEAEMPYTIEGLLAFLGRLSDLDLANLKKNLANGGKNGSE